MKEQKGITLIALIITIIVMLILVGVTVSVVIESGLLDTTRNSVDQYKTKANTEGSMNIQDVVGPQITVNGQKVNISELTD